MNPAKADTSFERHEVVLESFGVAQLSTPLFSERPFNAVSLKMDDLPRDLFYTTDPYGLGSWERVEVHEDGFGPEAFLLTRPAQTLRFRRAFVPGQKAFRMTADLFYQDSDTTLAPLLQSSTEVAARNFKVISRAEWGADESMRYWTPDAGTETLGDAKDPSTGGASAGCADFATQFKNETGLSRVVTLGPKGESLVWPLQYATQIRKFVVHHTDSEIRDVNGDNIMDTADFRAIVRAIYKFHTVSRAWGDIGYNYLIDPLGNIYEGRYGGDGVIGAHVLCHNNGTIGVAIIGNYEHNEISEPAMDALVWLMAKKAKQYGIDPEGTGSFRGKNVANLLGHRDLRATACPGQALYNQLPKIRQRTAATARSGDFRESNLGAATLDYNAELASPLPALTLQPNQHQRLSVTFKNTGKQAWDHNTWLHVALNTNPQARVIPLVSDKAFVAANLKEGSVPSGGTGTFEVDVEAGYFGGEYKFEVAPVVNGRYKVSRASTFVIFTVAEPTFAYHMVTSSLPSGTLFQGQKLTGWVDLQNLGNVTWQNYDPYPIRLGTEEPRDRKSVLAKGNGRRLATLRESTVKPGEVGRFYFDLQVPGNRLGPITERFTPVIEGVRWFDDQGLLLAGTIKKPVHAARITKPEDVKTMAPGEMKKFRLTIENKGDLPWEADTMRMDLTADGLLVFKSAIVPTEPVAKGQSATYDFWVQAPYKAGRFSVAASSRFRTLALRGGSVRFDVMVEAPQLLAEPVDFKGSPVQANLSQEKTLTLRFRNTGNTVWRNRGANGVYLAASKPRDRQSALYQPSVWPSRFRAALLSEREVLPGQTGTFVLKLLPKQKGSRNESFELVMEGVGWMSGSLVTIPITVNTGGAMAPASGVSDIQQNRQRAALIIAGQRASEKQRAKVTVTPSSTPVPAPAPTVTMPSIADAIRVRLSYAAETVRMTADKSYQVFSGEGELLFSASAKDVLQVRREGDSFHVQQGNTVKTAAVVRFFVAEGGLLQILSWEHRPSWNPALNDNRYRGAIEFRVVNGAAATLNELPLEDYLKGVAEVSDSAPFEKQKAMAVLARTYARFYMQADQRKFPGLPYDASDDPDVFQRYLGYGYELRSPSFVGAVTVTEGEVVTYQGQLVKTPYFNQSDGRTRSAQEVWGWTNTPYLVSVPDTASSGLKLQGHGVGLSGLGAQRMAEEGKFYEDIIKYYYRGVQLQEL